MKPTTNFIKQSQFDASSLLSGLRDAGAAAGSGVSDWYSSLNPEVKNTVMRGLLGAGAGATALGLTHALTAENPTDIKRKAMLGALLGGAGAVAIPAGANMLRGGITFPSEPEPGPLDRLSTGMVSTVTENPGAVGGGIGGGILGRKLMNLQGLSGLRFRGPSVRALAEEQAKAIGEGTVKATTRKKLEQLKAMTPEERRTFMNTLRGDVDYTNLTKSQDIPQRIPGVGGKSIRVPDLMAFKNIKDPRVKLLAAILGGAGLGAVAQKGVEGTV